MRSGEDASLVVLLDGSAVVRTPLRGTRRHDIEVPLAGVEAGARFACELEVVLLGREGEFDDYRFAVEDRRFV
jgi:hypothetical protein